VLKLYKKDGDTLRYWEAWVDEEGLTLHWGTVGEIGEHQKTPLPPDEDPDMVIAQAAEPRVDEGYDELEPDMLAPLVIQYPVQGKGTGHDFEKRKAVEELATELLGWTGNGEVEGSETKPGRMNIFCSVMDPAVAARTLVEVLEAEELLEGAIIALVPEEEAPRVLWPQGGSENFQP
jgi:predicted DNA-binding WGR domain protein